MSPTFSRVCGLATVLGLSISASAYTLSGYADLDCQGDPQQTIDSTFGDYCFYFDDKVSSIGVSGDTPDTQWLFFNNYPCSTDTQVGSFIGNGCENMGETKLKAVQNGVLTEGARKKRSDNILDHMKRDGVGTIMTWENSDCSNGPINELRFVDANLPVYINNVVSAMVIDVPEEDTAFACTDDTCHVDAQVATLENGVCTDLSGKGVTSAMVIGVPTYPKSKPRSVPRSTIMESSEYQQFARRQSDDITCDTENLPDYEDALRVGDDWQGDHGLECCCHIPGGPDSKSDGTAAASISDGIRCPADPSGTIPSPSNCPLNCNQMRSYIYAIATQCKTDDGKTGGTYSLPAGEQIRVYHS